MSLYPQGEDTQHLHPVPLGLQSPVVVCPVPRGPPATLFMGPGVVQMALITITVLETWALLTPVPRFPHWLNGDGHVSPAYLMELF